MTITSNNIRLLHFSHVLQHSHKTGPRQSYFTSFLPPLSSRSGYSFKIFLIVSQLYQKRQLYTLSYLEQLLCGMLYLLIFSKKAQPMHFRSPQLITILLCIFCFALFFSFISFSFLFLFCLVCPILLIYRKKARQNLVLVSFFCNPV